MALEIGEEWITSDKCKEVAKAAQGGWVLSWCSGHYTRDEAVAAMTQAEKGRLDGVQARPPIIDTPLPSR